MGGFSESNCWPILWQNMKTWILGRQSVEVIDGNWLSKSRLKLVAKFSSYEYFIYVFCLFIYFYLLAKINYCNKQPVKWIRLTDALTILNFSLWLSKKEKKNYSNFSTSLSIFQLQILRKIPRRSGFDRNVTILKFVK